MAKKAAKKNPQAVPTVPKEAALEKKLAAAEAQWGRDLEQANHNYSVATNMAWGRYAAALCADASEKSEGRDYDRRYDRDIAAALEAWRRATKVADERLDKTEAALLSPDE